MIYSPIINHLNISIYSYTSVFDKTSWRDYIWKDPKNRTWCIVALLIFLSQLLIFKIYYPFANYMPDSYSYIAAAFNNADVNTWPVAYSKFLRIVSVFTSSDKILVGLQYFFLQISTLVFLFSLTYFIRPGKVIKSTLLLFVFINPIPLYVANYISADALFIGLSLLWLTTLIWIIYEPIPTIVIIQSFLLLFCFMVRYNAIYYPILCLFAFLFSRLSWTKKIAGIALSWLLVVLLFIDTSHNMKEETGVKQFSAFGGWQLANNALYMYEHVPADQRGSTPTRFSKLEDVICEHMDTLKKVRRDHNDTVSAFFYLWNPRSPLAAYLTRTYKKDSSTPYFNKWANLGPLYTDYATYLISKYPIQYLKSFMLINAQKFVSPPSEFLAVYNMGSDSVGQLAKDWFKYKTRKIQDHKRFSEIRVTGWYSTFNTIINIFFILGLVSIYLLKAINWKSYGLPQLLRIAVLFWLLNSSFSIFASPIVLRYQVFPILVTFSISTILIGRIAELAFTKENT